jgi:hypothetical protein
VIDAILKRSGLRGRRAHDGDGCSQQKIAHSILPRKICHQDSARLRKLFQAGADIDRTQKRERDNAPLFVKASNQP